MAASWRGCDAVKLVVFDFDETITQNHAFYELSKVDGKMEMEMCTEIGQMRRIDELSEEPKYKQKGGFTLWALGGEERRQRLEEIFQSLYDQGISLMVLTHGLIGPTKKVLFEAGLLRYFEEVYGCSQKKYADCECEEEPVLAEAEFLKHVAHANLFGKKDLTDWGKKVDVIQKLQKQRGLSRGGVVFVDNDIKNIEPAKKCCITLYVEGSAGMTEEHLLRLRQLTRKPCDACHGRGTIGLLGGGMFGAAGGLGILKYQCQKCR